ncbi:O-methyltransferase [Fulvivirga lutea]|uniref:Class I SAM-dependent methyltransferase n=1 Tax=Fulvivirga lutea TaxID=2810512 RepID=A0A974ZZU1_9BACT|nr:class I SAM-dependent methyltransferase [Fulvivirga lutea]QSE96131.1 class I SAM-dependent methyltransferase [Fulvivirga lutea]
MSFLHQFKSLISYWLNEENEHSLHSPFVYDLYQKVIKKKPLAKSCYEKIEQVRTQFLNSDKEIELTDLGSKSTLKGSNKISTIASQGITKRKYCHFLDRLADYLEAKNIVELGTSLGINTLYLSCEASRKVTTFEGNPSLVAIAQAVFEGNKRNNVSTIEGDINDTLPKYLQQASGIDMVYFDANHTYEATMNYFKLIRKKCKDKACLVFDDIHRNAEMEKAWKDIKDDFEVTLSIDLFQFGLIFVDPEIRKQNHILTF